MMNLPPNAYKDNEVVKFIFWKTTHVPEREYPSKEYPEDSHIDFWVGDNPKNAPQGYELLRKPE